ncbi:MAG: alpha/beta fold hydrolase [Acidobacteriota bacterium]
MDATRTQPQSAAAAVVPRAGVLNLAVVGDEVPVLLLHHALGSFDAYTSAEHDNVAEWLAARGCQVVGFDLEGHGDSESLAEFPDDYLTRCVDDACAILGTIGSSPTPVVGVGFGALIALELAATHPELVACVVADSPPGVCPAVSYEPWPALAFAPPHSEESARLAAWRRFTARAAERPVLPEPKSIGCPVLLTVCADICAPELLTGLYDWAHALPQGSVALLPGDQPPGCWQAPGFFIREVERFLAAYA